jgi:hypothetical protein
MIKIPAVALLVSVVMASFGGCGGSSGGGGGSGVDGSKHFNMLTLEEKKSVCDYQAAHFGGYGKMLTCSGDVMLKADISQAECLAAFPSCDLTVAADEACIDQSTCATPFPASCAALLSCVFGGKK